MAVRIASLTASFLKLSIGSQGLRHALTSMRSVASLFPQTLAKHSLNPLNHSCLKGDRATNFKAFHTMSSLSAKMDDGNGGRRSSFNEDLLRDFLLGFSQDWVKTGSEILEEHGYKAIDEGKILYKVLQEGKSDQIVKEKSSPKVIMSMTFCSLGLTVVRHVTGTLNLSGLPANIRKVIVGMKEGEERDILIHPDYASKLPEIPKNIQPQAIVLIEYTVEILKQAK